MRHPGLKKKPIPLTSFSLFLVSSLLPILIHTRALYPEAPSSSFSDLSSFSIPSTATDTLDLARLCDSSSLDSTIPVDKRSQSDDQLDQLAIGVGADDESTNLYAVPTEASAANLATPENPEGSKPAGGETANNDGGDSSVGEWHGDGIETDASMMGDGSNVALEQNSEYLCISCPAKAYLIYSISHSQEPTTTPSRCRAPTDLTAPDAPIDSNEAGYIVYLVEYPTSSAPNFNPQAIVVTDPLTEINRRYDVWVRTGTRKKILRIVAPYSFKRPNGQNVPISQKSERGILAPKAAALAWFESIFQTSEIPTGNDYVTKKHYTRVWVARMFDALEEYPGHKTYWHPTSPQS